MGYSPQAYKELDTAEVTRHTYTHTHTHTETAEREVEKPDKKGKGISKECTDLQVSTVGCWDSIPRGPLRVSAEHTL